MELTNEIIENYGFARINNSMFKKGNITLQNGWIHNGFNVYERILTQKKAYKVCHNGKYIMMIRDEKDLNYVLSNYA